MSRSPVSRVSLALTVVLTGGCVAAADLPDPQDPALLCADSLAPGETEVVADLFDAGTRGIAFSPDGRLFVTTADTVEEVLPGGAHGPVAELPEPAGLEWWNESLAVVSRDVGDGAGAVYALDPDQGEPELFVHPLPGAESATATPWGSLVVASPAADEEIVEVTVAGGLDGFIPQVPSPFGVGFATDGSAVWVGSLLADPSTLLRFPIEEQQPLEPTPVASWGASGASEILVAPQDEATYVALAGEGRVARVAWDADAEAWSEATLLDGVDGVTGLALGVRPWDPCALYLTSPSTNAIVAVGLPR